MIKKVEENQLEACLEVIHKSFMTVANEFELTKENCPTNGAFMPLSRLQNDYQKGDLMFSFIHSDKIIGFVQISPKGEGIFELEKLSVLPDYRHKGYGKQLIDFTLNKVKELGGNKITIGIIEDNKRLKQWYSANGFIHTGTKIFAHLPFVVGFMEIAI